MKQMVLLFTLLSLTVIVATLAFPLIVHTQVIVHAHPGMQKTKDPYCVWSLRLPFSVLEALTVSI